MPVTEIDALDWTWSQDLDDAGSAADFEATYRQQTAAGVWDPAIYNGLQPYQGEANPHLVAIMAEVDGLRRELVVGVVDENGRQEGGDDRVRGHLAGRDRMALLLDRYPAAAFTLEGAVYDPETDTLTYRESFTSAVQKVCAAAGVPVRFGAVVNYKLGSSVVVSPDRTFAQVLAELLAPLRFSERHRVDAWWEGDRLYVGSRTQPLGVVQVDAARLISARITKSWALPAGSVRVEGFSYQREVDDLPERPTPGLPWFTGYQHAPEKRTVNLTVEGRTEAYTVEEIEYYNARGQLRGTYKRIEYLTKSRTETTTSAIEFDEDPFSRAYGNKVAEWETHYVTAWEFDDQGQLIISIDEVIRERDIRWTYWDDNGDTKTMDALEVAKDQSARKSPLPLEKREITRQRFRRSLGQIWRDTEVITFDEKGLISRSVETREVGPFKLTLTPAATGRVEPAARVGKRMETVQIAAGPEDAAHVFSSALIGDQASADAIRAQILSDRTALRHRASFTMKPDMRIRPGRLLQVVNADAWWGVTSFYITAVRMQQTGTGAVLTAEGVAWA